MSPVNFIHPTAILGENVKVWHFAVIQSDVRLCANVSIGSHTEIGKNCIIGENSRISQGCFLPADVLVGDNVFIGPGTTLCDDKYPRVNNLHYTRQPPRISDNASIGAGCVILPGIRIGRGAVIGAGSVVTCDVADNTMVYGEAATVRITPKVISNWSRNGVLPSTSMAPTEKSV